MSKRIASAVVCMCALAALFLSGCGGRKAAVPEPEALWKEIESRTGMTGMTVMSEDYLWQNTGIEANSYEQAICCVPASAAAPDEIIIVRARDRETASEIEKQLKERLAYKEQAATRYLTEYMPVIRAGFVRRDGLTVSLIVSEKADEIRELFDRYG